MQRINKLVQALICIMLTYYTLCQANAISEIPIDHIIQMNINSTINPATLSHLKESIKKAQSKRNAAILIQINTPGGLVSVTKNMITELGKSKLPFIAVIGPEGGSATSAGAILSAASHFLFMYPGTNIGAATPITVQDDMPKDSRAKAINDLVSLVSSLRQARGKVEEPFKEMVTSAKSFSAKEAIDLKIADQIINGENDILNALHLKTFILNKTSTALNTQNTKIEIIEMDLGQKILNILASPELAYILFLLGAALIYFELQAPGGFVAGGIGVIALLLAGISFQVIPLNYGGLGLIILSFALFTLEIYITSFGILSLAGIISLVSGSLFLFRTNDAYFELSKGVIFSVTGAIVTFMAIIMYIFIKSRKQMSTNFNDQIPGNATIVRFNEKKENVFWYQIKTHGEIWSAYSTKQHQVGDVVAIEKKDEDNMAYKLTD